MKENCFQLVDVGKGLYSTLQSFTPDDAKKVVKHLRGMGYKRVTTEPECMGCELWGVQVYGGPRNLGNKTICVRGVVPQRSAIGP